MLSNKEALRPSLLYRVLSCIFYGVSSILIVFINKIVLTNYQFPSFICLGIGQMVAIIVVLSVSSIMGSTKIPCLSVDVLKKLFPLPLLYVTNLVTGLGGTKKLNLPMFTVLRRFSILFTMLAEYFILGNKPRLLVQLSVYLMIVGAIIAAIDDLSFDKFGYSMVLLNDVATAANGVCLKKKLDSKDLGKNGLLFYNALFMLPVLICIAFYTGDLEKARAYPQWTDIWFVCQFIIACVCGFILNYSIFLCTQYNSALTTACIGPIKNIFVTYGGMVISGDYLFSMTNFIGINVSVVGSIIYAWVTFALGVPSQA